jgi:hypothetical protein
LVLGGVLPGVLSDAVKSRRLSANPAKGIENLPRKRGKRRVYLSADDVYRLADEANERRELVRALPAATSPVRAVASGLRWCIG